MTVAIAHVPRPQAVVIGSGLGGLAAAIRLAARGYRVSVLEKLDAPGGRAYVHRRDGFAFDAGPTIITAPFLLEELWQLCGKRFADDVELRLMDPFYRIRFDDGRLFDYSGDAERVRAQIAEYSPADVAGYDRFMAMSEQVFKVGFEQLAHVPFTHLSDMLRVVPDMVRLESYRSVYGMVSRYIKDPFIRQVLSFHPLLIGGNPFVVTSIYVLISFLERKWGVYSAMGGTGAVVQGLVNLIEGQGTEIRYQAEVERILVKDSRAVGVRLTSGEEIKADIVVSNVDPAFTYGRLLAEHPRQRWTDRRIERAHYSNGLFVWYFGTRRQYPEVKHHSILLGPRYRGLIEDIFKHKHLAEDFSLYLYRPTATDPSLAPPGCDTFYALAPVPHLGGDADWETQAEPYRARIARYLSQTLMPGLEDEIATSLVTTPLDFKHRLNSHLGAGFSLEPLLLQSAWFRPHNQSEEVQHLYLVGAGTHPGAGVPGVISSARILDRVVPDAASFV
ncbi:phytoene desaturase [Caldichromatium japonicum]|uniref:Phytoene dehydrogenase n=1 Tax=Caldichromatium japonicum TaxID=2699430 RepID=A0A6G7VFD9_9GAMM|nr:phytoene desaturase [Caldichromatium japonicum]QIK38694.1 phytoene desaturase [Caldichromatium japonicum]